MCIVGQWRHVHYKSLEFVAMGMACVPWSLLHVSQVMNVQHAMLCLVVDYITPAVNGHGRGMRLGTCLVQQPCVFCAVAFAACVTAE